MKDFEKLLNGKLPKNDIMSGMILSVVRSRRIRDKQRLIKYLQNQELVCMEGLAKSKGPTMNDRRRRCVRKLEEIRAMKKMVDRL